MTDPIKEETEVLFRKMFSEIHMVMENHAKNILILDDRLQNLTTAVSRIVEVIGSDKLKVKTRLDS